MPCNHQNHPRPGYSRKHTQAWQRRPVNKDVSDLCAPALLPLCVPNWKTMVLALVMPDGPLVMAAGTAKWNNRQSLCSSEHSFGHG